MPEEPADPGVLPRAVPSPPYPQADVEERLLEAQRLNEELRRMEVGGGGAHEDNLYGRVPLVPDSLLRVKWCTSATVHTRRILHPGHTLGSRGAFTRVDNCGAFTPADICAAFT
jgi:hypothetical protein